MSDLPAALRRYLEISGQPADSAFHTTQVSISFGEAVDAAALRSAWEFVVRAHPALRARFDADGNLAEAADAAFAWTEFDWQAAPPADLGAEWQSLVQADAATPVAAGEAPPGRITLLRLPNGQGHALWSFHAALLDDASISVALHRWLHAYDCLRTGEDVPAFEPSAATAEPGEAAGEEFAPTRPLLVLPLPDAATPTGTRRSISQTFERPERRELAAAAEKAGAGLRALFGAAWAFVLARATASDDALVMETLRSGEGLGRLETFVLRRRTVAPHATAADLIRAFADPKIETPNSKIQSSFPAFVYREHTLNDRLQLAMPRWMAADTQLFQKTAPPITLRVIASDRPEMALDYDPAQLSDAAARSLFEALRGTLAEFVADPGSTLATFALPGPPAQIQSPEVPSAFRSLVTQGIHEMFADAAAETPDEIAVEMGDEKITFSQLNATANQIARLLRKRGVEPGARVGIAAARSPRWIAALLGALKAGAAIVPLGTSETSANVQGWIVDALPDGDDRKNAIRLEADADAIASEKSRGMQGSANAEAIAWAKPGDSVLTGLSHEAVAAALQSLAGLLALSPGDRVLQFAPPGTFAAVAESLATLLSGTTLVLRPGHRWPTRTAFQEFVQETGVTALLVPTPFWSQWVHYLAELSLRAPATLRLAISSGNLPAPNAVTAWAAVAGDTRWRHHTAPAIGRGLIAEADAADPCGAACLGQPDPATTARAVDSRGLTVPLGFPGRVEITVAPETFVPLEIEALVSPGGTFYARPPLQLLVAGDTGIPTEESIRHAAASHPQIFDAHVERRLIAARNEWCLWIVPRDSERGEPHDFREWLAGRLAAVPRLIRALPRFPLDDAGEVDLAALAEMPFEEASAPTQRPGTELEERVRQAVSRALGGRRIDLDEILADGRTKPQVARLLFEAVSRDEPRVELADFTTGFSVRSLLRNVRGRRSGAANSAWTPLQPLRASGKRPPLVFIHDLDGTAKPYAPLVAHLGEDQPCYAITARGLADPESCHATVEEMAAAYVAALRVFDAAGPYRLLGYGFGGLVAFEMARRLQAEGAAVPLLVALATEPPATSPTAAFLAGGWKRSLPALFGRKPAEESTGRRRRSLDTPVLRANQEAARKYTAPAADLSVHVFSPERDFPSHRTIRGGWSACSRDAHFYQVPCSGPEMMDEPAVEAIAGAIEKLARAESLGAALEE